MYVTILDEKAKVYKDMDLNSPLLIELVAGNVVELGNESNEWVEVILPRGQHGYIIGDTNIYQIRKAVLLQEEVVVYEQPSTKSIMKNRYKKGVEFYIITEENGNWVKIRDISGEEGFIDGETKVNEVDMWTIANMKNDLRGWGFGLIAIGFISIALAGFLDPVWGFILIVIGVLALLIKHRGMFIVIGIALLLVGIMNISVGEFGGWTIFGFLQLYWGAQEIFKFHKYSTSEALVLSTETFLTQKLEERDSTSSKSKISKEDTEKMVEYCSKCGNELGDDAIFCSKCGIKIEEV